MSLVSIDLGIRGVGIAIFTARSLETCDYIKNPARSGSGPQEAAELAYCVAQWLNAEQQGHPISHVRIEWPRIYQRGGNKTKGDPNDLRGLWTVGGAIAGAMPSLEYSIIEPADWKGQLPHEALEARVFAKLSPKEEKIMRYQVEEVGVTAGHNVVDAVGIGLHFLGRLDRQRVIHRRAKT